MKKAFETVFEDEHLIAVNKQSGVLVIPGRSEYEEMSLKQFLANKFGEIYTVHRIDEDTSGLVLFAKTAEAHREMNLRFRQRSVIKKYLLFTRGLPVADEGTMDLPLKKLTTQNKSIVAKDGKEASTSYKVLEKFKNIAYCEAEIHTGRHHQIRVHFKAINSPLLVDPIYGDSGFFLSELKPRRFNLSKDEVEKPLLARLSLHASYLSFNHPITEETITLEASLPKDFQACLNQFRKLVH